ncbi:uncharacterized protein LOC142765232 [Rhipicephalus microplus]|uniref:uncharacterized protein LOC142765232 n=1 Tax=Rhipicephalus microplus TaxID=6941 RepID=UPI003F6A7514
MEVIKILRTKKQHILDFEEAPRNHEESNQLSSRQFIRAPAVVFVVSRWNFPGHQSLECLQLSPKETTPSLVLFSIPSGISDNIDGRRVRLHRAPVQSSPRLKEAPHGEGLEQTKPLLLRILRIQLGIRQQQREVLQEVRQLKHKVRLLSVPQHAQPAQRPSDLPRLPAGTIGEVEAAVQSKAVAAALRKHLLQIGGRGFREIGVNAMKAVLAHDVQVLYSLHGRKGKRAFVNLRLCRLVTDVICQKAGCDQAEALNIIKRWLPGSGDRCVGRKRRFREAFVVKQPDDPHSECRLSAARGSWLPAQPQQPGP